MKIDEKKIEIGIDVHFKRLLKPKFNKYDDLPTFRYNFFLGYISAMNDVGLITNEECEFLDKCAVVAYEIVK